MTTGVRSGTGSVDYWIEGYITYLYRHTTRIEQKMARLLDEMNVTRENTNSNQERMEAKIRAEIKIFREKMDSNEEKAEACHRKMEAKLDANKEKWATNKRR
jgi:6-phosphogluconolactonase/glucosamine-6-phosphate isomerase/deaminase